MRVGPNWHDVELRLQGEAVADVEANFRQHWGAVTGAEGLPERPPALNPNWHTPAQIARTIPPHTYPFAQRGE